MDLELFPGTASKMTILHKICPFQPLGRSLNFMQSSISTQCSVLQRPCCSFKHLSGNLERFLCKIQPSQFHCRECDETGQVWPHCKICSWYCNNRNQWLKCFFTHPLSYQAPWNSSDEELQCSCLPIGCGIHYAEQAAISNPIKSPTVVYILHKLHNDNVLPVVSKRKEKKN